LVIQLIPESDHNTGDIPDMFCSLAEAVIPEFLDDQVLWRMKINLTQWFSWVDFSAPLNGETRSSLPSRNGYR
jgi:hypothetical protein